MICEDDTKADIIDGIDCILEKCGIDVDGGDRNIGHFRLVALVTAVQVLLGSEKVDELCANLRKRRNYK